MYIAKDAQAVGQVNGKIPKVYSTDLNDTGHRLLGPLLPTLSKTSIRIAKSWMSSCTSCALKLIGANGNYRGELIDRVKGALGLTLEIVGRLDGQHGFQMLPKRWIVERTFG